MEGRSKELPAELGLEVNGGVFCTPTSSGPEVYVRPSLGRGILGAWAGGGCGGTVKEACLLLALTSCLAPSWVTPTDVPFPLIATISPQP